jgi:hypothetical protein
VLFKTRSTGTENFSFFFFHFVPQTYLCVPCVLCLHVNQFQGETKKFSASVLSVTFLHCKQYILCVQWDLIDHCRAPLTGQYIYLPPLTNTTQTQRPSITMHFNNKSVFTNTNLCVQWDPDRFHNFIVLTINFVDSVGPRPLPYATSAPASAPSWHTHSLHPAAPDQHHSAAAPASPVSEADWIASQHDNGCCVIERASPATQAPRRNGTGVRVTKLAGSFGKVYKAQPDRWVHGCEGGAGASLGAGTVALNIRNVTLLWSALPRMMDDKTPDTGR